MKTSGIFKIALHICLAVAIIGAAAFYSIHAMRWIVTRDSEAQLQAIFIARALLLGVLIGITIVINIPKGARNYIAGVFAPFLAMGTCAAIFMEEFLVALMWINDLQLLAHMLIFIGASSTTKMKSNLFHA